MPTTSSMTSVMMTSYDNCWSIRQGLPNIELTNLNLKKSGSKKNSERRPDEILDLIDNKNRGIKVGGKIRKSNRF